MDVSVVLLCGCWQNWDQFQISTNTTGFGANATHTSRLTVEQLGEFRGRPAPAACTIETEPHPLQPSLLMHWLGCGIAGAGCSDIMHNCSGHGYCDFCFDRCTCKWVPAPLE